MAITKRALVKTIMVYIWVAVNVLDSIAIRSETLCTKEYCKVSMACRFMETIRMCIAFISRVFIILTPSVIAGLRSPSSNNPTSVVRNIEQESIFILILDLRTLTVIQSAVTSVKLYPALKLSKSLLPSQE